MSVQDHVAGLGATACGPVLDDSADGTPVATPQELSVVGRAALVDVVLGQTARP